MLAEPIEPELAGAEDLFPERAVGGEGVEAVRVVGLVEGELEIDGGAVEGNVGRRSTVNCRQLTVDR
jgi:hypothetical protein